MIIIKNDNSDNDSDNDNNNYNSDNFKNNDSDDNKLQVNSPHKGPIMLSFVVIFVESVNISRVSSDLRQQSSFQWCKTPCPSRNVTMMWYIYATPSYLYCWKQLWIN